jgi:hypothetical protein
MHVSSDSTTPPTVHITVGNFNLHFIDHGNGDWELLVNAAERGTTCTLFHVAGGTDNKECLCVTATAYNDNRIAKRRAGEENPEIDRTTIAATAPNPPEGIWRQQQEQQRQQAKQACGPLIEKLRQQFQQSMTAFVPEAIEMAQGVLQLKRDGNMRLKDIAEALGTDYQSIRNFCQLLQLPEKKQEQIRKGRLTVVSALRWLSNQPH